MTNREAIEILGELKKCYLGGIVDAIDMAIEAVKAQEPVEPYTKRDGKTTFFLCGGCNEPLCIAKDSYKPKHCPMCGQAVKWG